MMRNKITKTVPFSLITYSIINEENEIETRELKMIGNANEKEALRELRCKYGNVPIKIINITVSKTKYEMKIDKFIRLAEKI